MPQHETLRARILKRRPSAIFTARLYGTYWVLFCLILVFSSGAAWAAKGSSKISVFVLQQQSKTFGKQTVYVSPTALRLDLQRLNCSIVTRLPSRKLFMFSSSKKLYYEKDIKKWHSEFIRPDSFEIKCHNAKIYWRPIAKKEICGITCSEYILGRDRHAINSSDSSLPRDPAKRRYFLADSMPLSTESAMVYAKACKITPQFKMPFRVKRFDEGKNDYVEQVKTVGCEKKAVSADIFSVPNDYKRTRNEFDVFIAFGDESDPMTGIEDILFRSSAGKDKPSK